MLGLLLALAVVQGFLTCAFGEDSPQECRERYRKDLEANPKNSLVRYRLAECLSETKDLGGAANEYREALHGDGKPPWTKVWSHIGLGKIFDITGQRERALNEYWQAEQTKDNTRGAQDEAAKYKQSPYKRSRTPPRK